MGNQENNKEEDTLQSLIDSWKFEEKEEDKDNKNVSDVDKKALRDIEGVGHSLKLSYFYQTHVLPQPWWGNIKDPKIIVLALNPRYDPKDSEIENYKFKDDLKKNLDGKGTINWLDEKYENYATSKWWREVLGEILKDKNVVDSSKDVKRTFEGVDDSLIHKKVGFFNLCGYHSFSFHQIKENCLKVNNKFLPTQNTLASHINKLIKEVEFVIVIWGYKKWKQLLEKEFDFEENKYKLLVVNNKISVNKIITKSHNGKLKGKIMDSPSMANQKAGKSDKERELTYTKLYEDIVKAIISE